MSKAGKLLALAVAVGDQEADDDACMQKQTPRETPRPRPRPILRIGARRGGGGGGGVAFAMETIAGGRGRTDSARVVCVGKTGQVKVE